MERQLAGGCVDRRRSAGAITANSLGVYYSKRKAGNHCAIGALSEPSHLWMVTSTACQTVVAIRIVFRAVGGVQECAGVCRGEVESAEQA